jgi:hypothetical protein
MGKVICVARAAGRLNTYTAHVRPHPALAEPPQNAQRVDDFRRTRDRCHARIQELKSCTDSLFQGIFAHRFRRGALPPSVSPAAHALHGSSCAVSLPALRLIPDSHNSCRAAGTAPRRSVPR